MGMGIGRRYFGMHYPPQAVTRLLNVLLSPLPSPPMGKGNEGSYFVGTNSPGEIPRERGSNPQPPSGGKSLPSTTSPSRPVFGETRQQE